MKNPFVAGSWVRGDKFFGRRRLVTEILDGEQQFLWVAGTRRLGKTSLLKQLEYLSEKMPYSDRYISLFWDMQGARDAEGLRDSLLENLESAEERFEKIDILVDEMEEKSLVEMLRSLRRNARKNGKILLFLCDECEELINVEKHNPEIMPRLRRAFQQGESVRTVISATKRLMKLEQSDVPDTSPFLHGFIPPVYLGNFTDTEAASLMNQGQVGAEDMRHILQQTGGHPYLTQLICRRFFESGDLAVVIEEIGNDDMVSHFFAVDFDYLEDMEKVIVWHVLSAAETTAEELAKKSAIQSENLAAALHSLVKLGYLRKEGNGIKISNHFFERWLTREKDKLFKDTIYRPAAASGPVWLPRIVDTKSSYIGQLFGHYQIQSTLGQGGMGTVFKALDTKLERTVALKMLSPEMMEEAEFRKRFLLEARAASALNHSNIATIYAIEERDGMPFIVMEYVDGITLNEWRKGHKGDLQEQLKIARQIAEGLLCAHQQEIVHRDVKPENIMIDRSGTVKIMDFGLAKMMQNNQSRLTKTGTAMGTLIYMSPEQVAGMDDTDHRADIFSLGAVFFELFTGKLPYEAQYDAAYVYAVIHDKPLKARSVNPDLPQKLEALLEKMLMKEKEDRYQSLDKVIEDIGAL